MATSWLSSWIWTPIPVAPPLLAPPLPPPSSLQSSLKMKKIKKNIFSITSPPPLTENDIKKALSTLKKVRSPFPRPPIPRHSLIDELQTRAEKMGIALQ